MTNTIQPEAEKAFSFPVGAVSPLWLVFAGAAAAGAAVFWARQWLKPTNLEALASLPTPPLLTPVSAEAAAPAVEVVEEAVALAAGACEAMVEITAGTVETALETAADIVEVAAVELEVVADAALDTPAVEPDDLTRLSGIGPKLAAALAERGVTRFADIAAWSEADVERFDKEMRLMGRIGREAWIAQAKRFAEAAVH
jgi:predicted flap endonuclease-1-like 5' DNA nuclease